MNEISYITGNEVLLDEIKELWEGLNLVHHEKSPYFKKHFETNTFEKRKNELISHAGKGRLFTVLARDESQKNVGYCVSSVVDGVGEIESIFISPSYRKHGIGRQLMQKSLDWLEASHPEKVIVKVAVGNEEAFGFYGKFGLYPRLTELQMKK